jgi:hypothetical protein
MDRLELEGIARTTLEKYGFDDPPVDAFDLAHEMEIPVEWEDGRDAWRFRRTVHIGRAPRRTRIHGLITHEIAHILLDEYRIRQSERAANYLGAALLVPRRALDRQLRAGWDLDRLRCIHLNASAELLARRICDVRQARFSVWDSERLHYRIGSAHESERALVDAAFRSGEAQRANDLDGAWPIFDGSWRRVIVLAAAA